MNHHERDDMTQIDEFAPRERGLLIGNNWADSVRGQVWHDADGNRVGALTEAARDTPHIPDAVRAMILDADGGGIQERLDASEDPDAEGAFWAGFRDGVRSYLRWRRTGSQN
jgi:hypothetical protein